MIKAFHPPIEADFDYCSHGGYFPCRVLARMKLATNITNCSTILFLVESIDGAYQDWIHYSMLRIIPKELADRAYDRSEEAIIG
ncbi:MAG: hypothetical protein V7K21_19255 [Nostoc sp.]|uniref:hypothetical protein n=1 Tax=Nostoc sp. TaxID=1180 RepID=UPI002FF87D91